MLKMASRLNFPAWTAIWKGVNPLLFFSTRQDALCPIRLYNSANS